MRIQNAFDLKFGSRWMLLVIFGSFSSLELFPFADKIQSTVLYCTVICYTRKVRK